LTKKENKTRGEEPLKVPVESTSTYGEGRNITRGRTRRGGKKWVKYELLLSR